MTITTISLAVRNLTQVEVLNIKTKRHILAILKPSFDQSNSINPDSASTVSYPEITYPLAPTPPVSSNRPVTNVNHPQEAQPTANADNTPPANETSDELLESSAGNTTVPSSVPSEALPTETEERSLVGQPGAPRLHSSQDPSWPRDTRATRTFAILKMSEPGQNPWDLGSPLLNWETVMGTSIIHWFLPIERSPCCNHEDSESHFLVGPAVDRLRADFSLIKKEDVRKRGRQRSDSKYSESSGRRDKVLGRLTNTTELKDLNGQTSRLEHQ
jgi:palmitoyltransferase